MEETKTYGEVCQSIADWLREGTKGKFDFTADEILDLDKTFPALMINTLDSHMSAGLDATTVLVSDEYVAKKVWLAAEQKGLI